MEQLFFKNTKIVNPVVMTNETEFGVIGFNKFKHNPVGNIDPKTPDLMSFGVQFLYSQGGVERVAFEKIGLFYGFFPDAFGKLFKKAVKGCGGGYFHLFIDKFGEGPPFSNPTFLMVFFGKVQVLEEFLAVESSGVTKSLKVFLAYLYMNILGRLFSDCGFKFRTHSLKPFAFLL